MRVYLLVLPPLSYIHSGTNLLISCINEAFCQNQPGLDHRRGKYFPTGLRISVVENLVSRVSRRFQIRKAELRFVATVTTGGHVKFVPAM